MTAPVWIEEAVRAFGRQMGLGSFALNERGAAGVRFENGVALRLEYSMESLVMTAGVAMEPTAAALTRLLTGAHPDAAPGANVRAAWMERTGEGIYVIRLAERLVDVSSLEAAFRCLWTLATRLGKAVS